MSTKKYFMIVYGGNGSKNTTMIEQIESIIKKDGEILYPKNCEYKSTKINNLFFLIDYEGRSENCVASFYRNLLITNRNLLMGDITDSLYVKEVSSICSDF